MPSKKVWNDEYYVSFGPQKSRCWDEARKYGFVSAGGGHWFIRTLRFLERDCRVWVNVPGHGYVGVGIVEEPMVRADHFSVKIPGGRQLPITQIPSLKTRLVSRKHPHDPERGEHFVRVRWLETLPLEKAFKLKGLFGNRNSVCRPKSPKWDYTLHLLKERFPRWNGN